MPRRVVCDAAVPVTYYIPCHYITSFELDREIILSIAGYRRSSKSSVFLKVHGTLTRPSGFAQLGVPGIKPKRWPGSGETFLLLVVCTFFADYFYSSSDAVGRFTPYPDELPLESAGASNSPYCDSLRHQSRSMPSAIA